jgi:hypothetical protein
LQTSHWNHRPEYSGLGPAGSQTGSQRSAPSLAISVEPTTLSPTWTDGAEKKPGRSARAEPATRSREREQRRHDEEPARLARKG